MDPSRPRHEIIPSRHVARGIRGSSRSDQRYGSVINVGVICFALKRDTGGI